MLPRRRWPRCPEPPAARTAQTERRRGPRSARGPGQPHRPGREADLATVGEPVGRTKAHTGHAQSHRREFLLVVAARQQQEIRGTRRDDRPPPDVRGRDRVVLRRIYFPLQEPHLRVPAHEPGIGTDHDCLRQDEAAGMSVNWVPRPNSDRLGQLLRVGRPSLGLGRRWRRAADCSDAEPECDSGDAEDLYAPATLSVWSCGRSSLAGGTWVWTSIREGELRRTSVRRAFTALPMVRRISPPPFVGTMTQTAARCWGRPWTLWRTTASWGRTFRRKRQPGCTSLRTTLWQGS